MGCCRLANDGFQKSKALWKDGLGHRQLRYSLQADAGWTAAEVS